MSQSSIPDAIQEDLLRLGVRPGGLLLVHSSMKSLGHVPGGPEMVIRGLLAGIGSEGTLLMPALSYEHVTYAYPVFDLVNTPSNVGLVAETFRKRIGTLRSLHPTHSICAYGSRADELIRDHGLDSTPCGEHSPLSRLPESGGQVLMLGCGLEPNTSMHAVEELVEPEYLYDSPQDYRLILANGRRSIRRYRPHNFRGWSQRYDRLADVMPAGLRCGKVLQAECFLIEAQIMWEKTLERLRENPLYFVDQV